MPKDSQNLPNCSLIGDRIKQLRLLRNWKRSHVATMLGVSEKTFSRMENNEVSPSIDKVEGLAKVFEVDLSELLDLHRVPSNDQKELNITIQRLQKIDEHYERIIIEKNKYIDWLEQTKRN